MDFSTRSPRSRKWILLSAHLAANFREFQNPLLRAGSTSVGPCFPQDFSRFSAQRRVIALDTIANCQLPRTAHERECQCSTAWRVNGTDRRPFDASEWSARQATTDFGGNDVRA